MTKLPVRIGADEPRELSERDAGALDRVEPPRFGVFPFFSFTYVRTEITSSGGTTQVRAKRSSFVDGRLTHETFEGELDRSHYERAINQAWQQMLAPAQAMLQALSLFLPGSRSAVGSKEERE